MELAVADSVALPHKMADSLIAFRLG